MAAKLIVTKVKGGSRISLIGTSGTELLTSKIFAEPRGKGATLRSLKGLLGDDITVEDQTADVTPSAVAATAGRPRATQATARVSSPKRPAKSRRAAKAR